MQCRGQLRHDVTKKAIKAALNLCMHVIYLYESHLKNMSDVSEMVFKTVLEQRSSLLSSSSNTLDLTHQLINRDFMTGSGSEKVKRVERKYYVCQIRVTFSSCSS